VLKGQIEGGKSYKYITYIMLARLKGYEKKLH